MSAASGIGVTEELSREIDKAKKGANVCFQKVIIRNEKLIVSDSVGKLNANIEKCQEFMTRDDPCFIIYFKGPKELMLLSYMPDSASSKNKMTYSSSKGSLTSYLQRDSSFRLDHFYGTARSEFTLSSIHGHAKSKGNKQDTSAMSSVERALVELAPSSLSKNEISKSAGYGLLAHIAGKAPPIQLKGLNPLEPPKNSGLSVKVQILNKDREKIYASDNKTKCVLHDCFFKRFARGYCERHSKIYNDTPVPGPEGSASDSGSTTSLGITSGGVANRVNKINGTTGNSGNYGNYDNNSNYGNETAGEDLESASSTSSTKPRKGSLTGVFHQNCAVDGCGDDRVPGKAYCAAHANEMQQIDSEANGGESVYGDD